MLKQWLASTPPPARCISHNIYQVLKVVAAVLWPNKTPSDIHNMEIGSNVMSPKGHNGCICVRALFSHYAAAVPRKHNTNENHLLHPRTHPYVVFSLHFAMARATYRAITVRKQTYKTESGLYRGREGRKNQYPRGC